MSLYSTNQLIQSLDSLHRGPRFLLDKFFPLVSTFGTEEVSFDRKDDNLTLAPFVSPLVPGKAEKTRGSRVSSFKPAYVKPKHGIYPNQPLMRQPGERIGGQLSPGERRNLIINDTLILQRDQILRRKEWMAAQVLKAGKVTIVGADYPEVVVDYERDAGHTVTLTGGSRWAESDVSPYDNLEDWMDTVSSNVGAAVSDVILGGDAWKNLKADAKFEKAQDRMLGQINQAEFGMNVGDVGVAKLVAVVSGVSFWTYNAIYKDSSGVTQKLIGDNDVILAATGAVAGAQLHGAIQDGAAGYAEAEYFPKNWVENDPPVEFVMTQSAPIVAPGRPNATFYVQTR